MVLKKCDVFDVISCIFVLRVSEIEIYATPDSAARRNGECSFASLAMDIWLCLYFLQDGAGTFPAIAFDDAMVIISNIWRNVICNVL